MALCLTTSSTSSQRQGPSSVSCSVISDLGELESLQPAWRDLLARSAANEPMLSPTWLLTWWRVYGAGSGRQLRVGLFHEAGRLVGLAPLCRRRYWYRPGVPFRRLEPLGADVDEDDGVGSDYLNVIAERGAEAAVAQAFAHAVAARGFGTCDEVVLSAMDGEGPLPALLTEAFRDGGWQAECAQVNVCPYIPLPSTWEDYLKGKVKEDRKLFTKSLRSFDEWAGKESQWFCASTAAELEEGKRVLMELHGERWRDSEHKGVFHRSRFRTFQDTVMPLLLAEGVLRLYWVAVRGRPIAAVYNILWNGKVYYYQCGRSLDVPKGQRPGIVILAHTLREAMASGCREFDLLAGDSQYKRDAASLRRPLVQVRAVPPSLREQVRRLGAHSVDWARRLRTAARAWLRRRPPESRAGTGTAVKEPLREV